MVSRMSFGRLACSFREVGFVAALSAMVLLASSAVAQSDAATVKEPHAKVLWKYAPTGCSFNGVKADNGTVFALDRKGKIHALDGASGEVLWTSSEDIPMDYGFGITVSPNLAFPAVLVGCDKGFYALDRTTGKKLWHTEAAMGVAGPACTNDAVIAGSGDGKVYACALTTGKILWQHDYLDDAPDDPPSFDGDSARFGGRPARPRTATTDGLMVVLSIFDQCRALALDAKTGKRLWAHNTQGWIYGTPSIGPRNVFVGSQDKHIYAVDKQMGKLMWQVKTGARVESGAVSTERFAYFGSCDAKLYCVDQTVGRVVWKFATEHEEGRGSPIYSRPLVIDDTVYLAAMAGKVYAVDCKTGKLQWKFEPLANSELNSDLILDGGRLFVTTRKNGKLGESAVLAISTK
ncbi:MAG: outer membrane protein assembly factor BamB [Planctomycetota bacterium]|jgi:outer membrane protein assembly factor BamB